MKPCLERQELSFFKAGGDCLLMKTAATAEAPAIWRLKTRLEAIYHAKTVILATGTFLAGRVYVGDCSYESGPDGMFPATELANSLKELGIPTRALKPARPPG